METKARTRIDLPTIQKRHPCSFEGYDAISLMAETTKLRKIITKRGMLEILIPLCCTTNPVRSYHVKSYHVNAYLNKTLDEQSADFHRHMRHIENFTDSFLYEFDIKKIYAIYL